MGQPVRGLHERRSASRFGERDPGAVGGREEPDPLPVLDGRRRRRGTPAGSMVATNWYPRPWTVRITACRCPSSPTARRAALIRLVRADSPTNRSPQTSSSSSCFDTTRSRWATRWTRTSNTRGSTWIGSSPRRSSKRIASSVYSPNRTTLSSASDSGAGPPVAITSTPVLRPPHIIARPRPHCLSIVGTAAGRGPVPDARAQPSMTAPRGLTTRLTTLQPAAVRTTSSQTSRRRRSDPDRPLRDRRGLDRRCVCAALATLARPCSTSWRAAR